MKINYEFDKSMSLTDSQFNACEESKLHKAYHKNLFSGLSSKRRKRLERVLYFTMYVISSILAFIVLFNIFDFSYTMIAIYSAFQIGYIIYGKHHIEGWGPNCYFGSITMASLLNPYFIVVYLIYATELPFYRIESLLYSLL